jgi:ubiquinone/menaquinone biosynthesis C-methylase UbiE
MNELLSLDILKTKKDLLDSILAIENPFHEKKEDAQMKWLGVADTYHSLGLKANTLIDLGCGPSSLPLYFKTIVPNVYGVDFYLDKAPADFLSKNGVSFVREDVEHSEYFEPNSTDCIVDACAIGCSMKLDLALAKAYKWLKPGGYLISVGDSDINQDNCPFASPKKWVETAKEVGFELVGGSYDTDVTNKYYFAYGRYMLHISRLVFRKPVV